MKAYLLFLWTLRIVSVIGWCMNIYAVLHTGFEVAQWGGLEVLRIVGIFVAPLGSILGLFF